MSDLSGAHVSKFQPTKRRRRDIGKYIAIGALAACAPTIGASLFVIKTAIDKPAPIQPGPKNLFSPTDEKTLASINGQGTGSVTSEIGPGDWRDGGTLENLDAALRNVDMTISGHTELDQSIPVRLVVNGLDGKRTFIAATCTMSRPPCALTGVVRYNLN